MFNTKSDTNNKLLLGSLHGLESTKITFQIPTNVRLLMLCALKPCPMNTTTDYLITDTTIKTYEDLLCNILHDEEESFCVFEPGTIINEMKLSGSDAERFQSVMTGKWELLSKEKNMGVYEIGQNFKVFNNNGKQINVKTDDLLSLTDYILGSYIENKFDGYRVEADGFVMRISRNNDEILLSQLITQLLEFFPGGFTLLLSVCRGGYHKSKYKYKPNGLTIKRALKKFRKYKYSTKTFNFNILYTVRRGGKRARVD